MRQVWWEWLNLLLQVKNAQVVKAEKIVESQTRWV